MKRLGALLLVLVLTLSVMPMGAMAASDPNSNFFLGWKEGHAFASLTSSGDIDDLDTWSEANPTFTGYSGLGIYDNATFDSVLSTDYLFVSPAKALTVSGSDTELTVREGVIFLFNAAAAGSIVVKKEGTLIIGNTKFETGANSVITISPTDTVGASSTSAEMSTLDPSLTLVQTGVTSGSNYLGIAVTGGPVTITNLVQAANTASLTDSGGAGVTFMGNNTLIGTIDLQGNVTIGTGARLDLKADTITSFTDTGDTVTVKGILDVNVATELDGKYVIDGGTVNVNASATFASVLDIKANGTVNVSSETTFEDAVTINANGTLTLNEETEFTTNPTINGTLNIGATPTFAGAAITVGSTGTMNLGVDFTVNASPLTVSPGGTLKVKDGKTLNLDGNGLIVNGVADFGTGGKLKDTTNGGIVTITGALYMKDPAVQVLASVAAAEFRGNGTIYTDHRTWFIRGYADPNLKYVGYTPLTTSYGESILVNTPVLAPATSNYSGYGDFIINTSGLFSNFDPNESLYANNQKLQVGVDYEVNDKGGYAIFTIYESFMQSQSGPIVFRATFKNGYSGSTTVNAQSATIPAEIGVDAPKTGMSASVMGFVVIAMAIALAVVVRKVKA